MLLLLLAPAGAWGQQESSGYLFPGQIDDQSATDQQQIDQAMRAARWQVGHLFVQPWLSVHDIALVSGLDFDALGGGNTKRGTDLTAAAGLGLRAYVPIGLHGVFALHALPEYVWWRDQDDRRRVNGRYGAGVFSDLGRTTFELTATRADALRFFSREVEERVSQRIDRGQAKLRVGLVGAISLLAEASTAEHSLLEQGAVFDPLARLDRTEQRYRLGLTYRFVRGVRVGVSYLRRDIDAVAEDGSRDAQGRAIGLSLEHMTPLWLVRLEGFQERIDLGPSQAVLVEDTQLRGRGLILWRTTESVNLDLYANRDLVLSISDAAPAFDDARYGIGLRARLGRLAAGRVFVEGGQLDFSAFRLDGPERTDDLTALGANFRLDLRRVRFELTVVHSKYDSNLPEFDRSQTTTRLNFAIDFGIPGLAVGSQGVRVGTGELSPWS